MNFINFKAWQSCCMGAASVLALCLGAQPGVAQTEQILFDDFSYTTTTQLANNGWRVRTWEGGPGLANGTWSTNNISFVTDPAAPANKFMRLKASTNINGSTIVNNRSTTGSVSQAEVARVEQIYKNGTWAARMYFNDAPSTGPDGDTAIETFFGLTDYIEGAEPYSEIDFEYLPNGGWWTGSATPSMWSGTYRIVDWSDESNHGVTRTQGSLQGWHTLVMQVQDGLISFYIDGAYQTSFSGAVAPDYPMYLMFQLWFSNDCFDAACNTRGYINNSNYREYFEDVDWVYFEKNNQVPATEIPQKIANLRAAGTSYVQNINGNSTSSIPAASSRPSSSSRSSVAVSSSSSTAAGQQCNWWGTIYAICTNISSGWGWQNNADCVGIQTCQTLSPPYGVVGATASSSSRSSTPLSSSRSSSSAPAAFSRLIQAESYSVMSGVQLDATNDGGAGQYVGWIDAGDWMSYASINFPSSGTYKVEYRVASPSGSVLSLDLNAGAIQLGQVAIPATGGWQNWTTVSHNVNVTAGTYALGIYAPQAGWNINWIRITKI
ncbi:carbohydrate-binding protein [Cellvibrio sp.]